ncbi:MAG: MTAP family purine nucleoside phosphorylase [Candidatus Thermoplasmatota archaeon]
MKIGIISSISLSDLFQHPEIISIETPYGSIDLMSSTVHSHELLYLNRHGKNRTMPPHQINYHANIHAFAVSHVDYLLMIETVSSMNPKIQIGDYVIPHDFIDMTKNRIQTYVQNHRIHIDLSEPFCPTLRIHLITALEYFKNIPVHTTGVYLTTEGPRRETCAEMQFYSKIADIVGMTLASEVILAREKNLCCASICLVENMAAGLQQHKSTHETITFNQEHTSIVESIVEKIICSLPEKKECRCQQNLSQATL